MNTKIGWRVLGLAALLGACSGGDDEAKFGGDKLEHGDTPECDEIVQEQLDGIGLLWYGGGSCTATLIGPRTILTAAHCFDYTSVNGAPSGHATFEIDPYDMCGRNQIIELESFVSFAKSDADPHEVDIAVGLLRQPVNAGGSIRHFSIASGYPANGSLVWLNGRGLSGDAWQDLNWGHALRRAQVLYDYGDPLAEWRWRNVRQTPQGTKHLASGDSGGPALSAAGAIFAVNSGIRAYHEGYDYEFFADPVFMNRRTALRSVIDAYAAGENWPRPAGANGWACADGTSSFCDGDDPGYLRECSGTDDLFADQRKYCPGGCSNGACQAHACDGLAANDCDGECIWTITSCSGTSYSQCAPKDLPEDKICAALHGESSGPAPTPNTTPTGSGCCTGDNLCANPPSSPGCPMTFPGGYCDPDGDGSYTDGDWVTGYDDYQDQCGPGAPPPSDPGDPPPPPAPSCPCAGDNRCANPPSTPGCPMTFPGGYCDPNGDSSYSDGEWVKGYDDHQAQCG